MKGSSHFYDQFRQISRVGVNNRVIRSDNHYQIKSYKIRQSLSCRTDYIIYCVICTICNKQCVGSSVKFRARLSNHKSHIKQKKRTCRLVNHFIDSFHHHQLSNLKFVLIEQVSTKAEDFLEQREGYWQDQLWTYEPYGFNARKEFNSGRRREFLS